MEGGKHRVYVVADGISSCNKEEVPLAVAQLRQIGIAVSSSESIGFRLLGEHEQTVVKQDLSKCLSEVMPKNLASSLSHPSSRQRKSKLQEVSTC